ncbi:phage tail protein [Polaribacter sp. Q13]|uniref:phage tail protein n=1 Tax=Polaribacter sp. Q13 TaxID=2806551 RepID=UPI00193BD375|nr:phage tail protein [Polaribacter sp. Q13]QVY64268.1 tail fiber protein [Polaribacter sp. Q13]
MKSLKITLILLFISLASFAQSGMVFQGIARDNNSAALTSKTLTFAFKITKSDGSVLYEETQQITTDNFGVFSHVIGTGTRVGVAAFGDIAFSDGNLKAIINVNNGGVDTQIYDQPFEYVPYAKHAANGVPIGTILSHAGDAVPDGYVECNGQGITDAKYAALRTVLGGATNAPNLGGVYLKGAGTPNNSSFSHPIGLRALQDPSTQTHTHTFNVNGNTNDAGIHDHNIRHSNYGTPDGIDHGGADKEWGWQQSSDPNNSSSEQFKKTDNAGNHNHNIAITGQRTGHGGTLGDAQVDGNREKENRPFSYGVRYIIKY